jgi:VanZ family protein
MKKNTIAARLLSHLRLFALITWIVLLIWMSLDPAPPIPPKGFFSWDKFLHAFAYFTVTILAAWTCAGRKDYTLGGRLLICGTAVLLGGVLEIAQGVLTSARTAELGDFAANCVGIGSALFALQMKNRRRKISRSIPMS